MFFCSAAKIIIICLYYNDIEKSVLVLYKTFVLQSPRETHITPCPNTAGRAVLRPCCTTYTPVKFSKKHRGNCLGFTNKTTAICFVEETEIPRRGLKKWVVF